MAYWIDYGSDKGHSIRCSNCGEDFGDNRWLTEFFYCPSCGEKMDTNMETREGEAE